MVNRKEKDFKTCKKCGTKKNVSLFYEYNDKTGQTDLPVVMCEKCFRLGAVKKLAQFGMYEQATALAIKWGLKVIW